ncbi:hypothetical protein BGZ60DRAFT_179929 [Tricladium varicosporioides]|nr:hypothetical protein BGZ60DRAFT_179929 [Hymenoscyphus varicosporioides]
MSANSESAGPGYLTGIYPSVESGKRASGLGMELTQSRFSSQSTLKNETNTAVSNMSTLALRPPMLSSPSIGNMWEDRQSRSRPERIELPSISQAVPEIRLRSRQPETEYRVDGTTYSATTVLTREDYPQSPSLHKRRRLSSEEDGGCESRDRTIPRLYRSPGRPSQRSQSVAVSPTSGSRQTMTFSPTDSWNDSSRNSPYMPPRGLPAMKSPPPMEPSTSRQDWRPTLPSLPALVNQSTVPVSSRGRSGVHEYALDASHSGARAYPQMLTSAFDPPMGYHSPSVPYGYQQPRGQSYSGPSQNYPSHDRTPFSSNHQNIYPSSGYPYSMNDSSNDNKQRKRRGNLPKETTDKLRAWFVAHLQHPYPTEDEKQDLMRQTGLQISRFDCMRFTSYS